MAFSDSNRTGVRFIKEAVWGVTPAGPNMKELNFTSESFKSNVNTVTSETIRSDRNVSDITQVGGGAAGDVGFELRYGDIEDLFEGILQSTWATTRVSTAVASAHFSTTSIRADSSALNAVAVDQVIRVSDATTAGNDGDYIVYAVSTVAGNTYVHCLDASTGVTAAFTGEVAGASTLIQGKMIRNGVTPTSYTIEKEFSDVSSFAQYAGMRATTLSLNFESQTILTGTIGFTGKNQVTASATLASATTAASTNEVMNASGNVARVWEGSNAITGASFQSITLDLNNNPREQAKVGSDALAGVGTGRCEVTGTLTAYFENNSLIDKFTGGTKSSFRFQIEDNAGNAYIVTIPRTTYTDFTIVATGPNNDVVQEGSWGASINTGGTHAIQIDALDA